MLRSRCSTFVAARRPANVHPRWTRGRTLRRFCRAACHRSFTTSATVRTTLRVKPCGWVRNQAKVRRVAGEPAGAEPAHGEDRSRRVAGEEVPQRQPIVSQQPLPGSRPLLDDAASPGRFAISTRPSSRSYQRKAGTRRLCRAVSPTGWPASCRATVPSTPEHVVARGDPAPKRGNPARLDRPPKDGKATPSNWTKTTPSTSGSATGHPPPCAGPGTR